jgi:hypothetical protein
MKILDRIRPCRCSIALLGALFLSVPVAHADTDTISTFTLTGDLSPGQASLLGFVTINTTTGAIDLINLSPGALPFSSEVDPTDYDPIILDNAGGPIEFGAFWDTDFGSFYGGYDIVLPVDTLVGYTGGPICSAANICPGGYNGTSSRWLFEIGSNDFDDGQMLLDPLDTYITPEPPGFILLATGAVGLFLVIRRRTLPACK